jgi:hypothetical protein
MNLTSNLKANPLLDCHLKSREAFSKFIYRLHEIVNKRLGKKSGLSYCDVREMYEHFRSRCTNNDPPPKLFNFSKKKEKDGTEVVGNIIKAKAVKSRLSRENREVEMRLYYDERGLDRYYGLLPLAVEGGVIERVGNRYVFGENKFWEKDIMKNPESFFAQDVLELIDVYAQKKFKYGSSQAVEHEDDDNETDE